MNTPLLVTLVLSCLLSGVVLVALLTTQSFTNMSRLTQTAIGSVAGASRSTAQPRKQNKLLQRIGARYDAAGISPPAKIVVLLALIAVLLFAILVIVAAGWSPFVAVVLGLIIAGALFYADYTGRRAKRINAFQAELPPFLLTLASSLRAGLTLDQAITELTRDSSTVLGQSFIGAKREVELGKTWHESLMPIAVRMNSQDLRNLIEGLALAQETGSSLTGILEAIAESCLERAQLKREIKTLTAEGMLSAYVIIALPFIVFLFLLLTQPSYVSVLWQPGVGMVMGIATLVLIAFGWVWLRRTITAGSR